MGQTTIEARGLKRPLASIRTSLPAITLRFAGLALVDAIAVWLLIFLVRDGVWPLALGILAVTLLVNAVNLTDRLYPLRWMSPAFSIIMLLVLYPIIFTVYTAFTNYSDGHLLTKIQTIRRIGQDRFLPEGGQTYQWTGFRSEAGDLALWLISPEGQTFLARAGEPLQEAVSGQAGIGELDENGIPTSLEGYTRLEIRDILPILDAELCLPNAPLPLAPPAKL